MKSRGAERLTIAYAVRHRISLDSTLKPLGECEKVGPVSTQDDEVQIAHDTMRGEGGNCELYMRFADE